MGNNEIFREKKTPSPRLEQEDPDILNSIVPEPSIVIVPEPSTKLKELMKNIEIKESSKSVEIPSKNVDDNEEIAPPSPYANNNEIIEISSENKNDVIINDIEKAVEIIP